eukprot:TRINITY_DN7153_c0_g1_i1.p2 TRINITY_DN7153_c0_g1~~TRINITY_DN7153_c0_g1_i1.p2  ORF type:complete len:78 (+),score=4.66 TRINITY_DN7153_c0_g1_i1:250-483(+)
MNPREERNRDFHTFLNYWILPQRTQMFETFAKAGRLYLSVFVYLGQKLTDSVLCNAIAPICNISHHFRSIFIQHNAE